MNGRDPWSARQVVAATLTAAAVVATMALLARFAAALVALFVAILVASAIRPVVDLLARRMTRMSASVLVHVVLALALFGFAVLVLPIMIEQISSLWTGLPELYASIRADMAASGSASIEALAGAMPATLDLGGTGATVESVSTALGWLGRFVAAALTTVAVVALSFYWTVRGERTVRSLLLLVPIDRRAKITEVVAAASDKLAAFVRGQVVLCVAVGVLAFVSYSIIGVPHALVLAILAGMLEAVPLIGPALGAIPASLVAFAIDPTLALWVIAATVVIQLLENYLLAPRVMVHSVGIHPLLTIVAITAFGALLGIVGALLAIPLAALAQLLVERMLVAAREGPATPGGRDQRSALRYEAQGLVQDVKSLVRDKEGRAGESVDSVEEELESIATDLDRLLAAEVEVGDGTAYVPGTGKAP